MKAKSANFLLCILLNSHFSFCQIGLDGVWTNGTQLFYTESLPGSKLQFEGGTLHEGGFAFYCEILTPMKIRILGSRPGDDGFPGFGESGWTLEYKKVNGFEILTAKDSTKMFKGFLLKISPQINFESFIIRNKINFQLAGKYIEPKTEDSIIFYPDSTRLNWNGKLKNYEFQTEYDTPADVITIGNRIYFYEKKSKDLLLFKAESETPGEYEKGKLLHSLILKETFVQNPDSLCGDYFFASFIPLTEDIIRFYSPKELKIIRNEIFARHGYIFTDKDIKKYFESKSWYKPIAHNVSHRFSEIERLNIEQIKRVESEISGSNKKNTAIHSLFDCILLL